MKCDMKSPQYFSEDSTNKISPATEINMLKDT
jgi:hypothetical protein